ncbi:hypothetical protein GCM10022235_86340 [Kribbella ginsengisoli]|uniref:Uncharacterized protein n=1 Tax=Kribbella ginsengisoli TaxID=363865 RepID=A0ABP6ZBP1_9ACTN
MDRVDVDRWERGSWVNDLPWLIRAKRHQAGKSLLREAIEKTSGEDIPLTPLYGALGWQEFNGRTHGRRTAGASPVRAAGTADHDGRPAARGVCVGRDHGGGPGPDRRADAGRGLPGVPGVLAGDAVPGR